MFANGGYKLLFYLLKLTPQYVKYHRHNNIQALFNSRIILGSSQNQKQNDTVTHIKSFRRATFR